MNKVIKKNWDEYLELQEYENNIYYISDVPVENLYDKTGIFYNGNYEKEYNFDIIIINNKAYSIVNFLFRDENLEELINQVQKVDIINIHDKIIKKKLFGIINTKKTIQFFCENLKLIIE